jgi:hypothetical protein
VLFLVGVISVNPIRDATTFDSADPGAALAGGAADGAGGGQPDPVAQRLREAEFHRDEPDTSGRSRGDRLFHRERL